LFNDQDLTNVYCKSLSLQPLYGIHRSNLLNRVFRKNPFLLQRTLLQKLQRNTEFQKKLKPLTDRFVIFAMKLSKPKITKCEQISLLIKFSKENLSLTNELLINSYGV